MNVCFNGCSFTSGDGIPVEQRDDVIYDRLISKKLNLTSNNIALGGSSNYEIFMRSANAIMSGKYDLVITQWSVLNRICFNAGPDSSARYFANDTENPDFRYRDLYISSAKRTLFRNMVLLLNHDYQNIIDLIDYCSILKRLAGSSTQVVFINGLIPWGPDLVNPLRTDLSTSLGNYSKSMLDFDNRNKAEVIEFFKKLQDKFTELDTSLWVNIFNPFMVNRIDRAADGEHPGPISHQWMATQLENYLTNIHI
jgi:hypothetical protein